MSSSPVIDPRRRHRVAGWVSGRLVIASPEWGPRWWTSLGVALVTIVHLVFLWTPLHIDEAGAALVGQSMLTAHDHGSSLYGSLWLDRSPLLVALYGGAQLVAGAIGVRLIGLVGAIAFVLVTARLARRVGGERAIPSAVLFAAVLASAPALSANLAYQEIVAAPVSAAAVLMALRAARSTACGTRWWIAAGAVAACAALFKQSFVDALLAVAVASIIAPSAMSRVRRLAAAGIGVVIPIAGMVAWAALDGAGVDRLLYALLEFRIEAADALAHASVPLSNRFTLLGVSLVAAGFPVLAAPAAIGARALARRNHHTAAIVTAWCTGAAIGVLGGGYYWPHYVIELAGPMSVLAAVGVTTIGRRDLRWAIAAGFVAMVVGSSIVAYHHRLLNVSQRGVLPAASIVRDNRRAGDTGFVIFARANVMYYTQVRPAFPYQWSLMYRTLPSMERQAESLLASNHRPTWVIGWQRPSAFGVDRDGDLPRILSRGYRLAAVACEHPVWIRNDDHRYVSVPTPTC